MAFDLGLTLPINSEKGLSCCIKIQQDDTEVNQKLTLSLCRVNKITVLLDLNAIIVLTYKIVAIPL